MAAREMGHKGRVIIVEGDGSIQMTAQGIGTMIKHKLDIIILLINNDGYTIERWVHGMEAEYNDIVQWKYADIPAAMGGKKDYVTSFMVRTRDELEALWETEEFRKLRGMKVS
jgi:pyruvate decarboxylase